MRAGRSSWKVGARFNWAVHAYCLMDNHYHLVVETPDANLAQGMRQLNGLYTQRFSRRHGRVGHVFQGRYKAILVQRDGHLLELARYVVLNPVRAGMARSAKDWPWSSYRATAGQVPVPPWLTTEWLLSTFSRRRPEAIARYKAFVSQGKNLPSPWASLKHQIFLGDERFVEAMQAHVAGDKDLSEVLRLHRRPVAKPLVYYAGKHRTRDAAIAAAYASGGYGLKAIGEYFGLHYSRVSRIVREQEKAKGKA